MKREIISQLHSSFELAVNETDGVEYWFARDLQELLGYAKWENFIKVIDKAKIASTNAKQEVSDHFLDVRKMVELGSGAKRERLRTSCLQGMPVISLLKMATPVKMRLHLQ